MPDDPNKQANTTPEDPKRIFTKTLEDGTTVQMTAEEALEKALKADKLEKEVAATRSKVQLVDDLEKAKNNDPEAFRRVAKHYGYGDEAIDAALKEIRFNQLAQDLGIDPAELAAGDAGDDDGDAEDDDNSTTPPKKTPKGATPTAKPAAVNVDELTLKVAEKLVPSLLKSLKVGVDNLEPRLQQGLSRLINTQVGGQIDAALDNDPVLGKFKRYGTDKQWSGVRRRVYEKATAYGHKGHDVSDRAILTKIFQEVRADLANEDIQPIRIQGSPGLGSSSSGGSGAGFDPDQVPERPKKGMSDPAYDEYLEALIRSEMER